MKKNKSQSEKEDYSKKLPKTIWRKIFLQLENQVHLIYLKRTCKTFAEIIQKSQELALKCDRGPIPKIHLVGGRGTGKSTLARILVIREFNEDYAHTTYEAYRKNLEVDGEECQIDIYTGPNISLDEYYRQGDAFLIIYSITMRESFSRVDEFIDQIKSVKGEQVPIILIGNKSDIAGDREVSTFEANFFAKKISVPFFETSAKLRVNVEEAFLEMVRLIRRYNLEKQATNTRTNNKKGHCILN